MKADCFSEKQYIPMMLSNGNDAVLVDYCGSMMTALANHAHHEQHQGCPLGWYKVSHCKDKPPYRAIQPIVQSGYFVIVDSQICDVSDYEQCFDAVNAILVTKVSFREVKLAIESFLTDDGVLVEKYYVQQAPSEIQIVFFVDTPLSWVGSLELISKSKLDIKYCRNGDLQFKYCLDGVTGDGVMFVDKKPDGFNGYPYEAKGVNFDIVKKGWSATKYLALADPTNCRNYKTKLSAIVEDYRKKGFKLIKKEHKRVWKKYSNQSHVKLPDKKMQYLYDLSRYSLKANQHQDTGGITVGMLPHLWAGGTYVPYDAYFSHHALMQTNSLEQSRLHLDYYRMQRPNGKRIARRNNLPGSVYSGWTNCYGQHRAADFEEYVFHYKPVMSAIIALKYYWQWVFDPADPLNKHNLVIIKEILDLTRKCFIVEQVSKAFVKPCMAGDETGVEVENDTFTAILFARGFSGFVEMAEKLCVKIDPVYARLAKKLYERILNNYKDGILMTYSGAKYIASMQPDYFIFNLPEGTDSSSIYGFIENAKTKWGLDSSMLTEAYRDWPWWSSRSSISLAHIGDSSESFYWLNHVGDYVSSLGAMPEKIRMDGYAIGYWYSSPHALFVWAAIAALCHDGENGTLRLLWGLDGKWREVEFDSLRMAGGLLVSAKVIEGEIIELQLRNTTYRTIERKININPKYKGVKKQVIMIPPKQTIVLKSKKRRICGNQVQ